MGDYISETETAKLVRADLKRAFPRTKFGVRSKKYSGGSSIRVNWKDGPTSGEVEDVVGKYHGSSFDPMIDLKSRTGAPYANDYIFCDREVGEDVVSAVMAAMAQKYGLTSAHIHDPFDNPLPPDLQGVLQATYQRPIFNLREAASAHLGQVNLTYGYKPMDTTPGIPAFKPKQPLDFGPLPEPPAAPAAPVRSKRHQELREQYRQRRKYHRGAGPRLTK